MKREESFDQLENAMLHIGKRMHHQAQEAPCSPAQSHLLLIVADSGAATVKELAAQLHVTSGGATQHIEELERLGFIERAIHRSDRRKVVVTLTRRGKSAAKASLRFKRQMLNDLFGSLDDSELETLVALMWKACQNFNHKEN